MDIAVDHDSPTPPYEQVRLRIAELAAAGRLAAGTRLPPVRQLAAELSLAANTVARAYRELEQAGLVEGRGRHGTVVRHDRTPDAEKQARQQELAAAANRLARTARDLGVSDDAALAALRIALARRTQTCSDGR